MTLYFIILPKGYDTRQGNNLGCVREGIAKELLTEHMRLFPDEDAVVNTWYRGSFLTEFSNVLRKYEKCKINIHIMWLNEFDESPNSTDNRAFAELIKEDIERLSKIYRVGCCSLIFGNGFNSTSCRGFLFEKTFVGKTPPSLYSIVYMYEYVEVVQNMPQVRTEPFPVRGSATKRRLLLASAL